MKQKVKIKTSSSGNVIRSILRQELKDFATKEELKKFEKSVDQKFTSFETRMDIKMDIRLENLENRVDENARRYRDEVLTSNDKLAKRLEAMQEELEVGNLQMRRQLEDHEERVTGLESSPKS